jgi:chromosome segregation ATPase
MCKTYTLEDNDGLMAELKSMHGKMAEMRGRLERDEITPDEWREWYAGYQARLDEIKEAVSGMREEISRRNADLERQKRERAAELNMSFEEYENYLKSLIISWLY